MNVQPTTPAQLILRICDLVGEALNLDPGRVYLTPARHILEPLPPASGLFAAVVPNAVVLPPSPQHDTICPAELQFEVCLYSRVSADRSFSSRVLLTDPDRGLFPLGDKTLRRLVGRYLPDDVGQLLRGPVVLRQAGTVEWMEGRGLVLAYLTQSYAAPFSYLLDTGPT